MMLTDTQRQFVEVAARTTLERLHPGHHLSGYRSDCNSCGGSGVVGGSVNYEWTEYPCPYVGKSEQALTAGAYLLGKLEGANGATIEEIVDAAREASCDTCDGNGFVTYGEEEEDNCPRGHCSFDEDAFFRAVTIEALTGEGKVREEFGVIMLCRDAIRGCATVPSHIPRPLIIPRLAVEGAVKCP